MAQDTSLHPRMEYIQPFDHEEIQMLASRLVHLPEVLSLHQLWLSVQVWLWAPQQKPHHLISHVRKWQRTVKACLPSFQHHCIWGGNTFVQDEITAGWSPRDTFWVPVFCKLQHMGSVLMPVKAGFQKSLTPWNHITNLEMERRDQRMWHDAFLEITRSLVNNKRS